MNIRLDSPKAARPPAPHFLTAKHLCGCRGTRAAQPAVRQSRPPATVDLGRAGDWLFAKGGMSIVLLLALMAAPMLATLLRPARFGPHGSTRGHGSLSPGPIGDSGHTLGVRASLTAIGPILQEESSAEVGDPRP